jgi:hypothetical protein
MFQNKKITTEIHMFQNKKITTEIHMFQNKTIFFLFILTILDCDNRISS